MSLSFLMACILVDNMANPANYLFVHEDSKPPVRNYIKGCHLGHKGLYSESTESVLKKQ